MKYKKERRILQLLTHHFLDELLSFTFWNKEEKELIKYMYKENRTIDNIVAYGLMPYERSWLFVIYQNGLSKFNKWLKNTEKPFYKGIYKNLI